MKWIARILGLILVLIPAAVTCLAVLSSRPDANLMQTSITIHQTPAAIWPWLYEPDKLKAWVSWLKEVRSDSPGPPAPGRKAVWVMTDENNGGALMEIDSVVESVEPDRSLAVSLSAAQAFRGNASYKLSPNPDGSTLLESTGRYEFDNSFARILMPMIIFRAKEKAMGDMQKLKTLVEAAR